MAAQRPKTEKPTPVSEREYSGPNSRQFLAHLARKRRKDREQQV